MRTRQPTTGFTLLELLVVISIMALAVGVTVANFSTGNAGAQLKSEARKLVSHLRYVRVKSLSESKVYSVVAVEEGNAYLISPNGEPITLAESLAISVSPGAGSNNTRLEGIRFYPDGSSSGGAVTLSGPTGQYIIEVNWVTGEVSHAPG